MYWSVGMLSKRIRELRFSLGLNQVQFGQALNVTKQIISNLENDNIQPSVEMLIKIVNIYSVSADYLLGINERVTVDVSGLSQEQIAHIQMIIDDIRNKQLFKQKISLISYEVRLIVYLLNFNSFK